MEFKINGSAVDGKYFSKEQKADHRFVERAGKAYAAYAEARARWLEFVKDKAVPVFVGKLGSKADAGDETASQGKGRTIYNIPKDRRVVIKQNAYIKMNELAVQAKAIIDGLLEECKDKLPVEVEDLFGLLKSMFQEKKKMIYTPGIAAFVGMKNIRNKRLQEAQELLKRSMDADIGKVYMYAQKRNADGSWEMGGEEK
jgi:hypothetical protein